jgi:dihydroneopterin aldolase
VPTAPIPETHPDPVRRTGLSVFVRGLRIDAFIGVHAHERGRSQPLVVEVEIALGDQPIAGLGDTVNYEGIAARARAIAASGHVDLVEEYAERLARACLDDPHAVRVRVRIDKPGALAGADAAGCEVVFVRD